MYLSISTRYTLKDRPDGYLGLTGEDISYGKHKYVPFEHLAYAVIRDILGYYIMLEDSAALNAALDKLREGIAGLCVIEEAPDATTALDPIGA